MFIVELTYLKPLDAIEAKLEAHRHFLDAQYLNGVFLASGPKIPRDGGVILASGRISRSDLNTILAHDPFQLHGLASYRATEFSPVKAHPALIGIL
ncbi:YciI family protein [Dyella japonica]|uniref:YciI family protein n=1 Tax=Dyella japonica TaxID=231455 RepID=UPI0009E38863|nr:YciI family protein [Dyella japonica]